MAVIGDLNIVGSFQPVNTLVTGNIINEGTYGSDSPPDWDGSSLTDAHPLHNGSGPSDYTWRNDNSQFAPGRLDYIIYTDSVLDVGNQFVLNTVDMSAVELAATGLQEFDITVDQVGLRYDHLPAVVDFRLFTYADADFDLSLTVDRADLVLWEAGYGTTSGAGRMDGDANGDGIVDGRDLLIWQLERTGAGPISAAIPEPSSLALLLWGWLIPRRRSR